MYYYLFIYLLLITFSTNALYFLFVLIYKKSRLYISKEICSFSRGILVITIVWILINITVALILKYY